MLYLAILKGSNLSICKTFVLVIVLHISGEIAGYNNNYESGPAHQEPYHQEPHEHYGPFWDDFRVTWGPNTSYPHFNALPRTAVAAEKKGWYRTSKNCYNDGKFFGLRYAEPGGHSAAVSLLFDIQGTICGIQMSVPYHCARDMYNPYQYGKVPMFLPTLIRGSKYYTLTAYFIPPALICSKGRTEEDLRHEGTGTGLWFQDGRRTVSIPPTLEEAYRFFGWNKVQCFPQMGHHSFYRLDLWQSMECSRIWPYALLGDKSDKHRIHGFVFMVIANCHSRRHEHIPLDSIKKLFNCPDCPSCMVEQMGRFNLTTMHVYFKNPQKIDC